MPSYRTNIHGMVRGDYGRGYGKWRSGHHSLTIAAYTDDGTIKITLTRESRYAPTIVSIQAGEGYDPDNHAMTQLFPPTKLSDFVVKKESK